MTLAAFFLPALLVLPLKAGRTAVALPAALGLESAGSYLSRKVETYPACEFVNRLPGDVRVLPLVVRPYHVERPWVEPGPFLAAATGAENFTRALRAASITHVIVEPGAERFGYPTDERLFRPPFFRELGEGWPLGNGRRIRVYAVGRTER